MQVFLSHNIPVKNGKYLLKCSEGQHPHLVTVIIEKGQKPQIFSEQGRPLFFNEFPSQFFWSSYLEIEI